MPGPCTRSLWGPCLGEGVDQLSRFELRRIHDHSLAGLPKLIDVVALNVLILDIKNSGLFPFAEGTELHIPDDGLEMRLVQIVSELALIDAANCGDSLSQDLHFRV